MAVVTPKRQCTATSKSQGKRCLRPPIPGGTVCRFHGGGAPQVKRKAEERLKALVDPAVTAMAEILANKEHPQRLACAKEVLERDGKIGKQAEVIDGPRLITYEELALVLRKVEVAE